MVEIVQVLVLLSLVSSFKCDFTLKNFNYSIEVNRGYGNVTMIQTLKDKTQSALQFIITKDLPNLQAQLKIELMNSKFKLMDYSFDLCKIERYRRRNVFIRLWAEQTLGAFDYTIKCPIKKGTYTLQERGYEASEQAVNYVPSFIRINELLKYEFIIFTKKRDKMVKVVDTNEFWALDHVDRNTKIERGRSP